MFRYIIKAISRAIGFTKTESKGSLVLILVIITSIIFSHRHISSLKNRSVIVPDSADLAWLNKVQESYELKKAESTRLEFPSTGKKPSRIKDAEIETNKRAVEIEKVEAPLKIRDLNSATAIELQEVRGIGPSFSERIIKYRNLLGGFSDTTQLKEVYGLKHETILKLKESFQILSPVVSLNINSDSVKHLAHHPYISYDLARVIINYRKEHGDFTEPNDLRKIKILDDSTFMRIKPYLE